jgi:hypothetical protein
MLLRHGNFSRLDLQMLAMVDDLKNRLLNNNVKTSDSILMMGFSASGMFTNRFVMIHPERIIAASIGSPGGWAMVPTAKWNNVQLTYPVGVGDFEIIFEKPFNLEAFKRSRSISTLGVKIQTIQSSMKIVLNQESVRLLSTILEKRPYPVGQEPKKSMKMLHPVAFL